MKGTSPEMSAGAAFSPPGAEGRHSSSRIIQSAATASRLFTMRAKPSASRHGKVFVKRPFNTCLGSRKADKGAHFFIGDESLELPCQIILVHGLSVDAAD